MTPRRRAREEGQATLLIIGFAVVLVMMLAVAVDASAAYLRRQGLDNLADGAALAAADGVQGQQVYLGGLGERARIDPDAARGYVAEYLWAVDAAGRYPGLAYSVVAQGDRVTVMVAAPLDLPIDPPGWAHRPVISARAASYVVVSE